MKKVLGISLVVVVALALASAATYAAACKQTNLAGGNDSLQTCDVFKAYKTKIWVDNNANVDIFGSHTALSNLNLAVGDDVQGFVGTTGAASNTVDETTEVNTSDVILEMPSMSSSDDVDQSNADDDTIQSAAVVEEINEDYGNQNNLLYKEAEITLADNSANLAIGDDFEDSSVTVKDGNKNWVTKYRRLNASSYVRASDVIVE